MKKHFRRAVSCCLTAALLLGTASCTADNKPAQKNSSTAQSGAKSYEDVSLEGVELKIWAPLYWVGKIMSYDDNEAWQEVQKRTGVKLTFEHPTAGQERDQFNLMIAGDTLPDMICSGWDGDGIYIGGGDKYIDDGVVLRLNELVDTFAPDYKKTIETVVKKEEQKEFYTDSGNIFSFYAISPYEEWCYNGLMYRQDWMEELGLENPQTLDEVEHVLTQFKEKKNAKNPLSFPKSGIDQFSGFILTAWDIGPSFYQVDGKVQYGPIQPQFQEYLKLLSDWYQKGLIDKDFSTRDEDAVKRLITTGESGAIISSPDTVGAWMENVAVMMPGAYPTKQAGERVKFRMNSFQARSPFSYTVTTACKNPEAAVKFLNYGYTEEGYMLYNYGIEGETYEKTGNQISYNGIDYPEIKYTDKMMNNPDYPVLDAITKFKAHIGPFIRFEHEGNPAMNQNSAASRKYWTEAADTTYTLPMTTLSAEEGTEYARIINQVNTYQETQVLKFIMGMESLDNFDDYLANMEKLEIQKAIGFQQAALDRYNER